MSSWPEPDYPGEVVTVGYEEATRLYEEVPPEKRVYTFNEILMMTNALGSLPENEAEWKSWIDGHVEHMAAGGYVIGRPDPRHA